MTAKDQAVRDIENDLRLQGRCFMAFHTELDSTMRSLVRGQIREQMMLNPFPQVHPNSQLIGRCTFDQKTNQAKFENYDKYYRN